MIGVRLGRRVPGGVPGPISASAASRARIALVAEDPECARILAASAELIKQAPPFGFVLASDADYENVRQFHRTTRVKGD